MDLQSTSGHRRLQRQRFLSLLKLNVLCRVDDIVSLTNVILRDVEAVRDLDVMLRDVETVRDLVMFYTPQTYV